MNSLLLNDFRLMPDLVLVDFAVECFKLIDRGRKEVNSLFQKVSLELEKRNSELLNLAHRKFLEIPTNYEFSTNLEFQYSNELEKSSSKIDLKQNNPSIIFMKVNGDSMCYSNILNNDILIVLKTDKIENNDIIVINIEGILFVKRYSIENNIISLLSSNPEFPKFILSEDINFKIIGKVTNSIRSLL